MSSEYSCRLQRVPWPYLCPVLCRHPSDYPSICAKIHLSHPGTPPVASKHFKLAPVLGKPQETLYSWTLKYLEPSAWEKFLSGLFHASEKVSLV